MLLVLFPFHCKQDGIHMAHSKSLFHGTDVARPAQPSFTDRVEEMGPRNELASPLPACITLATPQTL